MAAVDYTDQEGWARRLWELLPEEPTLPDAAIDGAGGDVVRSTRRLLKTGGVIVCYEMTSLGQPELSMQAVMKNIDLKGSGMESRR